MTSDARVALPPGLYNVCSSESTPRGVVSPSSDGGQLYVTTASSTAANQQFLVSGVGVFTALDSAAFAFASLPSVVNALITRATTPTQWIVNVKRNANGSFTGYIMTSDTHKNYWGLNGNNLQLQDSVYNWTFVPL